MEELASIHASITYSVIPHHITRGLFSNTHIYRVFWDWERGFRYPFNQGGGAKPAYESSFLYDE